MHVNSQFLFLLYEYEKHVFIILKSEIKKDKCKIFLLIFPFYLQSTGTFFATARYGSATPVPPSVISRGVGWLVRCVYVMSHLHIMILFLFILD